MVVISACGLLFIAMQSPRNCSMSCPSRTLNAERSSSDDEDKMPENVWFIWTWINHNEIEFIKQNGYHPSRRTLFNDTGQSISDSRLSGLYCYCPHWVYTQVAPYKYSSSNIISKGDRIWFPKYGRGMPGSDSVRHGLWDTIIIIKPEIILKRDDVMLSNTWDAYGSFDPDKTIYVGADEKMRKNFD